MIFDPRRCVVDRRKVADYRLDEAHPDGRGKAVFAVSVGFPRQDREILAEALRMHAVEAPVVDRRRTPWGDRFGHDGPFRTPSGATVWFRTVWQVENDGAPRLVTGFPRQG